MSGTSTNYIVTLPGTRLWDNYKADSCPPHLYGIIYDTNQIYLSHLMIFISHLSAALSVIYLTYHLLPSISPSCCHLQHHLYLVYMLYVAIFLHHYPSYLFVVIEPCDGFTASRGVRRQHLLRQRSQDKSKIPCNNYCLLRFVPVVSPRLGRPFKGYTPFTIV